jgi:hypothetical protein
LLFTQAKRVFELGKRHLEQRKRNAATSLSLLPPLPQEMSLIHELYLRSKRMKEFNEISRLSAANGLSTVEEQGKSVWMKNLVFKNTEFMHMQVSPPQSIPKLPDTSPTPSFPPSSALLEP